jgi:catechol 2,3-dioxygenase-like lactoylglutathione lyase family enzyme
MPPVPIPPALSGIHHVKLPVADLEAAIDWYGRVLGAERLGHLDHHDGDGALYAVIVRLPGLDVPVELRQAPAEAAATAGYDPVTFAVADRAALDAWVEHLDALGVRHSPVVSGFVGDLVAIPTPDGLVVRLYTAFRHGLDDLEMDAAARGRTVPS